VKNTRNTLKTKKEKFDKEEIGVNEATPLKAESGRPSLHSSDSAT